MLQASCLGLIGTLTIVGCGGSETSKPDGGKTDGGLDTGPAPVQAKVTVSPALIDFGTVDVGTASTAQTVTVTVSGGAAALSPAVSGPGFTLASTTCQPTQAIGTCTVSVKFTPGATGGASGSLTLGPATTASVTLSGTGNTPGGFTATDRVDLGTLLVNQAATATVNILPQPSVASIACTASGGNLTAAGSTCPTTGAVSAPCAFTFTFKAATAGTKSDNVTCTGGTKITQTVVAAVVVTPAALVIQPNPAAFNAKVGETETVTLNVVNNGGAATGVLTAAITPTGSEFAVASTDCVALASLATCKVQVTFAPTSAGANKTATLTLSDGTVSQTASLTGVAVPPSKVAITPNPSDFGSIDVGQTKATTFTMTNSGGSPTATLAVASGNGEFVLSNDLCTGTTLAASATCTFTVTFAPATAGTKGANLSATQTGGDLVAVAKVSGTATTPKAPATLTIAPLSLDFGTTGVGVPVGPKTFTVTNTGAQPSGVPSVVKADSTSSAGASQFTYTTTCSGPLAANETCQVVVTYAPTIAASAAATFTVTDGTASTKAATVIGIALAKPPVTLDCGTTPFDDTVVGGTSAAIVCKVSNPSTSTQETGAITSAVTGDFAIPAASNHCGASLAAGLSCTFSVTFVPTAKGTRTGVLTVSTANGGAMNQSLTATGLGVIELVEYDASVCTVTDGSALPNGCAGKALAQPFNFGQMSVGATSTTTVSVAVFVRGAVGTVVPTITVGTPADFAVAGSCPTTTPATVTAAQVDNLKVFCHYTVTFTPTSKTAKTGSIKLTGADTSTDTATFAGTGTGPLTIAPSPVAFGTVAVGSNLLATITVKNNGATQSVTATQFTLAGTNAAEFIVVTDGLTNQPIAAGATATLVLRFVPASTGDKTATVTVNGTYGSGTETASVTLSGTGGTPASLAATIGAIADTAINATSPAAVVTVTNGGGAATSAITASVSGEFTLTPPSGTRGTCGNTSGAGDTPIAAGGTCTINVWFKPVAGLGLGKRTGTLTVSAATGGSATVALSANATPQITITPATIQDFGSVVIPGTTTTTKTFTITNFADATAAVTVNSVTNVNSLTPSVPGDFSVTNNCTAAIDSKGGTCTVVVKYLPSVQGPNFATLRVVAANGQSASVDMKGVGQKQAVLALTAATAMDRSFGIVRLGTSSAPVTYTITNTGDVQSGTLSIAFVKHGTTTALDKPADLVTTGTTCPTDSGLANGGSCNIVITYSPTACVAGTGCTVSAAIDADLVIKASPGATTGVVIPSASFPRLTGAPSASDRSSPYLVESVSGLTPYTLPALGSASSLTITMAYKTGDTHSDLTAAAAPAFALVAGAQGTAGLANEFAVGTNGCNVDVGANSLCTFTVVWTPVVATVGKREVTVTLNGAVATLFATVPQPAALTATPSPMAFGTLTQGSTTVMTLTVSNTGDLATSGNIVAAAGGANAGNVTVLAGGCQGAPLAAGASCSLQVRVVPSTLGASAATLTVTGGGSASTGAINLSWTSVGAALITPAPTSLTFVGQATKSTSAAQEVVLTNGANSAATGPLAISVDSGDFIVTAIKPSGLQAGQDCGDPAFASGLAAGQDCSIWVSFSPNAVSPAAKSGTVTIGYAGTAQSTVVVQGTAVAALSVSPASKAFASTVVGQQSATQVFTITNATGAPTTGLLTATLSGTNAAEFHIVADTCTGTALTGVGDATSSCTVTVRFDPTAAGSKTGTLTVAGTPGDSAAAALTATATNS